jgi:hypothetical protein
MGHYQCLLKESIRGRFKMITQNLLLLQVSSGSDTSAQDMHPMLYVIIGIIIAFIFIGMSWWYNYTQKLRLRPIVLLEDHCTDDKKMIGYYVRKVNFQLPSVGGRMKAFWAIQCKDDVGKDIFIVPSHGEYEDIVKRYDHIPNLVFVEAKFLGYGNSGPEAHREWTSAAFPDDIFRFDDIGDVPPNYILCKPHYSVGMKKELYKAEINNVTNMFTLLEQMKINSLADIEIMTQKYNDLMSVSQHTHISHMLGQWESITVMNDALLRQYTTSINIVARLLHIRADHVSLSGINHAISQGSITAVAEIIGGYRNMMTGVMDSLGMEALPKNMIDMTFEKANRTKEEALAATNRVQQLEDQIQKLIHSIRMSESEKGTPIEM